jgi:hypothetical protein
VGRLIALLVLVLAAGAGTAAAQAGAPVAYTTIERDDGGASGYRAQTTFVIRSERRWRHVWRRLHAGQEPKPRRPRVSFRRSTVIAVLGRAGTARGLEVDSVVRDASGMLVRAVESRPGAGCIVPQVITRPYELIRVARTAGPVRTERAERVHDCA